MGTVAQCVALLPHSKKVVGSSPARCNMSGLVPGPFCVEFACSPRVTRVPPIEPHNNKNMQKEQMPFGPDPDQDRTEHLDLVPGRRIAGSPTAPGCPWGRTPGWDKGREHLPPSSPACVCVCVCRVALKRACPPDFIYVTQTQV